MKSVLLVAALLSSTAGAAFAELQSSPGLPEGLILGADGRLYFDPNAGKLRVAAGAVPVTVTGPDAAGRYLNPRAPGGPQRVGRALTNPDNPLAVLALPFDGEGVLLDLANPLSGDGFGSRGTVGRSLGFNGVPYSPTMAPVVMLDSLNPWSGGGVGSPGVVGRDLVPYGAGQQVVVPGRFLTSPASFLSEWGAGTLGTTGIADFALAEELTAGTVAAGASGAVLLGALAGAAGTFAVDLVNPWSGDGFGSRGAAGRSLTVPFGVTGQMPYSNSVMAPVQYDVGPQGTTISITIPNSYNLGQMGMMPMIPAMSAPQYRIIPQYAAPAPVAYAAPATPANAAVAPAAANAGVKCQVGDQQAVALTVDACEEAGGLVQPMDAAQAAE